MSEACKDGADWACSVVEDYNERLLLWNDEQARKDREKQQENAAKERKLDQAFESFKRAVKFFNCEIISFDIGGVIFDFYAHRDDENYYVGALRRD